MSLRLSKTNKVIGGVCGGLSEAFDIDAGLLRMGWLVAFFFFGVGFAAYIAMWIIMAILGKIEDSNKKV